MLMEGVDFTLPSATPRQIGWKSLAVNLSDLAAMAGKPVACVVSVALPRSGGFELGRGDWSTWVGPGEQINLEGTQVRFQDLWKWLILAQCWWDCWRRWSSGPTDADPGVSNVNSTQTIGRLMGLDNVRS